METDRLLLRPRNSGDLDDCLAMDRDPLVTRFIPGPWSNPVEHRAFVLDRMSRSYPEGYGYWAVERLIEPNRFLGWILLLPYDAVADEIEIGWRFHRAHWGCGYASEAAKAILKYAFRCMAAAEVVADIDPDNLASIRVAEKIGMRLTEVRSLDFGEAESYQISRTHYEASTTIT